MFSVIDVHEAADGPTYVEDVFSAFTYTGNGSTQTIQNGIDLAGKGGLTWLKGRSGATDHFLLDTARGGSVSLSSNTTAANNGVAWSFSYNSDGFGFSTSAGAINASAATYVGWTFRKAPKFFDIVTYTGNGVAGRQIAHNLGIAPGMIVVKRINTNGFSWLVQHRGIGATKYLTLETTTAANTTSIMWNDTEPTDSVFTLGDNTNVNGVGGTYVAYLFAHDPSADGIIQCGSFTADDSSGRRASVDLPWEPQYLLVKRTDNASAWFIVDTSRRFDNSGSNSLHLFANLADVETEQSPLLSPRSNGFNGSGFVALGNYIFMAIRKGLMRPPTDASKVFDIVARTGTGAAATITTPGIKNGVDLAIAKNRNVSAGRPHIWSDRLRAPSLFLSSESTAAENGDSSRFISFLMDGATIGNNQAVNQSSQTYINYFFKQARGFLDIVGYTGTGVARTVPHNLGTVPELMIVKNRSAVQNWWVYYGLPTDAMNLNLTGAGAASAVWNSVAPTDSAFSVGSAAATNGSGNGMIAYLFASCPGVSKIGTYTGNTGVAQNIDCGFTAGARFVMIKAINSTGNWRYADSTRGIISGNDPYLLFNSTAAEVTSVDYLAPLSTGFTVTGSDSDVNASGGTYLYLSVS